MASATTPPPTISSFTASPLTVSTGNGTVKLKATVSNAVSCTLSSNPAVAGLPAAVPCSKMKKTVELPLNTSSTIPAYFKFKLTAQGSSTSTTKKVKVTVDPGEGGYIFPSKITGTESGGEAGLPFSLSFEFDRNGSCVASDLCDYTETSISGTGSEFDPAPGTCEQTWTIDDSGDTLAGLQAGIEPDVDGVEHLSFAAITGYVYPNIIGCYTALDWGLQHDAGHDDYTSNDVWTPGATTLSASYDDPGVESGAISFTFSYS
jgi:hypothetical protein